MQRIINIILALMGGFCLASAITDHMRIKDLIERIGILETSQPIKCDMDEPVDSTTMHMDTVLDTWVEIDGTKYPVRTVGPDFFVELGPKQFIPLSANWLEDQ